MQINHLEIQHFRNHRDNQVDFSPRINLILGKNGSGKTNLIDAIHVLCMSKSFVASSDLFVVEKDFSEYRIEGKFSGSIRSDFTISCEYKKGDKKSFFINDSPLPRIADLIGRVPVVVLSPFDRSLTSEGPAERRSFLDSMISQISPKYLSQLFEYRRVLKQRNSILSNESLSRSEIIRQLEPWDFQLASLGASIVLKRKEVLQKFHSYLTFSYQKMDSMQLEPHFEYKNLDNKNISDFSELQEFIHQQLISYHDKDADRRYTLIGPHRDDLIFFLNDIEIKKYGSQGQHRIFTIALKMAELLFLSDELDDLPIFLLDDMFGDLDPQKITVLLEMLYAHHGQTFITAANPQLFSHAWVDGIEGNRTFSVQQGMVSV